MRFSTPEKVKLFSLPALELLMFQVLAWLGPTKRIGTAGTADHAFDVGDAGGAGGGIENRFTVTAEVYAEYFKLSVPPPPLMVPSDACAVWRS